jgi:hypothetical protein
LKKFKKKIKNYEFYLILKFVKVSLTIIRFLGKRNLLPDNKNINDSQ